MLAVLRKVSRTLGTVPTVLMVAAILYVAKVHVIDNVTPFAHQVQPSTSSVPLLRFTDECSNFDTGLIKQLSESAKSMHNAKIHVRGTKTADSLKNALAIMDDVLQSLDIDMHKLVARTAVAAENICPEEFKGSLYGYPMYYNGFEETICSYSKSLRHILTVVTLIKSANADIVSQFINSITHNSGIAIRIATDPILQEKPWVPDTVTFLDVNSPKSDGWLWNQLVANVTTPYVLIARDAEFITEDARLERLVREIEMLQVPVAAGAVRYPDGHWEKGCYQSVHRNFTLRYLEGYDESFHECLFCDYSVGPFVIKTETIQTNVFTDLDMNAGLFEDLFLRLKKRGMETIVCPDSMFHIRHYDYGGKWKQFTNTWDLYKYISPQGQRVISDCSFMNKFSKSKIRSPCRLQANADAVKFLMKTCEQNNLFCEVQEGTSMGAVKMAKVLPWEYDADIGFLAQAHKQLLNLTGHFKRNSFEIRDNATDTLVLGYSDWRIEMYGQYKIDSELLASAGMAPTRVLLDGTWVRAGRNPGLAARNRYGHEVYRHALHWRDTGAETGWTAYRVGEFPPCTSPHDHDCIDTYNTDGNIQFEDPLP